MLQVLSIIIFFQFFLFFFFDFIFIFYFYFYFHFHFFLYTYFVFIFIYLTFHDGARPYLDFRFRIKFCWFPLKGFIKSHLNVQKFFQIYLKNIQAKSIPDFPKNNYRRLHFEQRPQPGIFASSTTTLLLYQISNMHFTTDATMKKKDTKRRKQIRGPTKTNTQERLETGISLGNVFSSLL